MTRVGTDPVRPRPDLAPVPRAARGGRSSETSSFTGIGVNAHVTLPFTDVGQLAGPAPASGSTAAARPPAPRRGHQLAATIAKVAPPSIYGVAVARRAASSSTSARTRSRRVAVSDLVFARAAAALDDPPRLHALVLGGDNVDLNSGGYVSLGPLGLVAAREKQLSRARRAAWCGPSWRRPRRTRPRSARAACRGSAGRPAIRRAAPCRPASPASGRTAPPRGARPASPPACSAPRGFTVQCVRAVRDRLDVLVGADQQRRALLAEAVQPGDAVGGVAGQRQEVGHAARARSRASRGTSPRRSACAGADRSARRDRRAGTAPRSLSGVMMRT